MQLRKDGQFSTEVLPIIGPYNRQRFTQFSPEDTANFYIKTGQNTKEPYAMYPVMGRKHVSYLGQNQLIFGAEPRGIFKTINYMYVVDGNSIFQVDSNYNQIDIAYDSSTSTPILVTNSGPIYFTFLVVNTFVFACFVDDQHIYIFQEGTPLLKRVTDPLAPGGTGGDGTIGNPGFIAAFGNRIVVSVANSSTFYLSAVNLAGNGATNPAGYNFDPNKCFTNYTTPSVFAQEDGLIRQFGVLNNTLYIFTDYITGVWSNIAAVFGGANPPVYFPWKKNSTYNWNFGIANPSSLDIDFGMMVFLARNSDGLLQFMMSQGGQPEKISDGAIDALMQKYTNLYGASNPFLGSNSNGFLFQYENTIFYRMSGGDYDGTGLLDDTREANSIEFSFEAKEWHRCIEANGERNRVKLHVYFNFMHMVTLTGDNVIYNLSGQYYYNEVRNPDEVDPQSVNAFLPYPIRYERSTPIIYEKDYSEFETEYAQIDFVFGESNINFSTSPYQNTQFLIEDKLIAGQPRFIVAENNDASGKPIYIVGEQGNTPSLGEVIYNKYFNPIVELYYSDDGGVSYQSADVRQFSQMGVYIWRMRWYQLGPSRNRVYKLVCVSSVPIVILGGVMNVRRISGGAN